MTAAEIARALGGAHRSGAWWRCRCPVHGSRSASLSLRDGTRGLLIRCWAGCSPCDVLAELRRLGLIAGEARWRPDRIATARRREAEADELARRVAVARRIWNAASEARVTPVVAYLVGRSINITPPQSLRYAPALRRPDGNRGPAMVARIDDVAGELIGIARTWLDRGPDGRWCRRDRAMLGRAAGGAARLAPVAEMLMVSEGVETSLAAMQATGQPTWAALSTAGLVNLVLPPIVGSVTILADHDRSGAGERAARTAAQRWLAEGRRVRIALPPEPGTDMADVLAGPGHAHIEGARDAA